MTRLILIAITLNEKTSGTEEWKHLDDWAHGTFMCNLCHVTFFMPFNKITFLCQTLFTILE